MSQLLTRPETELGPEPAPARRHTGPGSRRGLTRIWRGAETDPGWARPALLGLLAATAVLYLWGLSASGYGNDYYAAAVQAGTKSWKAFFFGSFDSSSYITVDKPPASLWVMGLSARLFGFGSWSLLAPQALEGVAAVGLLYGAVRRVSGHGAGLVAGAVMALTPAAVLMFRFDNPDALLTLVLVAAAYGVVRAIHDGRTGWLVLAGSLVGLGFLTKMGQALLVLPAFALAYAVAGPPRLGRRLLQLLAALGAVIVSAGWWVAIVELWPASSRPYIGGSTTNSVLDLAFGYNGLGRIFGSSAGNGGGNGGGGGSASSGFGGATGLTRLFSSEFGQEISWLLPAALLSLVAGLWLTRRAPRTGATRASLLVWGGWLGVSALVLSFMEGTVHPYYSVVLAPAIGALVAIGAREIWTHRHSVAARIGGAVIVAATGLWSVVLLSQSPTWHPELRYVVAGLTAAAAATIALGPLWSRSRSLMVAAVLAGAVTVAGSGAIGVATASVTHSGSIPAVGAVSTSAMGGGGRGAMGATSGGPGRTQGAPPSGGPGGTTGTTGSTGSAASAQTAPGGAPGGATSTELVALLQASTTRWAAAASSSRSAGPLELASGTAVMSIGGFNGSDAAITLAQFKALAAAGDIHYFIGAGQGGGGTPGGQGNALSEISSWVTSTFTATSVGGTTVYDLSSAAE